MALQYTTRVFFLQIPNELLKSYFESRDELRDFDWGRFTLCASDPLYDAWSALPEASREATDCEFREVVELAAPEAIQLLVDQGRLQGLDLGPELAACHGPWHKAFLVFLKYRRVFDAARQLHQVDHLNNRFWHRRAGMPQLLPDATAPARAALGQALSAYYRPEDRGAYCDVHCFRHGEKRVYIAYPQDVAESVLGYDRGALRSRSQRSIFEVVFAYDPSAGTLDLHARGGRAVHRDLQRIFARVVLGTELRPETAPAPFRLNHLRNRSFRFTTDPADGIREVRVKAMRIAILGSGSVRFDAGALRDQRNVYDLIDPYLQIRQLPLSNVDVDDVTLQMVFEFARGPQVLTFGVRPGSCTLRDAPEHQVARRCLRMWDIADAG